MRATSSRWRSAGTCRAGAGRSEGRGRAGVLRRGGVGRDPQAAGDDLLARRGHRHRAGRRGAAREGGAAALLEHSSAPDFQAKEAVAASGVTGSALNQLVPIVTRLARLFVENDMVLAEINPLGRLADGSFIALDAHMDMENEARGRHKKLLAELGVGEEETRQAREATPFELAGEAVEGAGPPRGRRQRNRVRWQPRPRDRRRRRLADAVRRGARPGGQPRQLLRDRRQPLFAKACGLAKLVSHKPGVDKIAVMMSIVSNTRVDIVSRR